MDNYYFEDSLNAVDSRFEAQKIAFAPFSFQAARAMKKLGILDCVASGCLDGVSEDEIEKETGVSSYGVRLLVEIGLGLGILKYTKEEKLILSRMGCFLQDDYLTEVNMDFMNDVCYDGAKSLLESIKSGKPAGLKAFGDKWNTVYEALSSLPEDAKNSWFKFDHNYSDNIFPFALEIVLKKNPKRILDIGGNTAKCAILLSKMSKDAHMTIIDLPGQTMVARENIEKEGLTERIDTVDANMLDPNSKIPHGADAIWMSQFLDCFSLDEITMISRKAFDAIDSSATVYVLEPLIDRQRFRASSFSLQETSLYFACIANGNSRMMNHDELVGAIEKSGLKLKAEANNLGAFSYTLLEFSRDDC